jgi:hypothetical protein
MVGVYPLPTGFITRLRTNPPPPRIASVNLPWYLSLASAWVLSQERRILDLGAPLTTRQLADAERAGVVNPQRVRILCVQRIPMPDNPDLLRIAEQIKLTSLPPPGLSLRYGIYISSEHWGQRRLLVHKLAHTAQYERFASVRTFLECYLYQCLAVGSVAAPLEQEAELTAERICGPAQPLSAPISASDQDSKRRSSGGRTGFWT